MATSKITTYQKNTMSNQNTNGKFKFYKFGNIVYCTMNANNVVTTDVTISGEVYHKIMDIPAGFIPIYDADVKDTLYNKRILFQKAVGMVTCSEVLNGENLRGTLTYMAEFDR